MVGPPTPPCEDTALCCRGRRRAEGAKERLRTFAKDSPGSLTCSTPPAELNRAVYVGAVALSQDSAEQEQPRWHRTGNTGEPSSPRGRKLHFTASCEPTALSRHSHGNTCQSVPPSPRTTFQEGSPLLPDLAAFISTDGSGRSADFYKERGSSTDHRSSCHLMMIVDRNTYG